VHFVGDAARGEAQLAVLWPLVGVVVAQNDEARCGSVRLNLFSCHYAARRERDVAARQRARMRARTRAVTVHAARRGAACASVRVRACVCACARACACLRERDF
jgi:hypothetical protein